MTLTRNRALAIMVAGLASALIFYRMQSAEWVQFAPHWHSYIRDGDATLVSLLIALLGLFLTLRR